MAENVGRGQGGPANQNVPSSIQGLETSGATAR